MTARLGGAISEIAEAHVVDGPALYDLPDHQAFILPWAAVPKGRPRTTVRWGFAVTYSPPETRRAEKVLRELLQAAGAVKYPRRVPLHLTVTFGLPKPVKAPKYLTHSERRPDLTNYLMTVADAGTGVLWDDDAQLAIIEGAKVYDPQAPQTIIVVAPIPFPTSWWAPRIVKGYAMDPRD